MIFEMSIEYIYCEKFRQTILRVVKLSDTRDYCKDIFNQWCYCFNCRYETLSASWNTLERNATL